MDHQMKFRVAVIGLGAAARNIHLPAYLKLNKLKVVGGCDTDYNKRIDFKKKYNFMDIFDNSQEMIEKTKPDIVSICTPPPLHYDQCIMSLNYGCHVFCEKPLADNLNQVDKIILLSDKKKRFVIVNSEFPYMNIFESTKNVIGTPDFGRLLFLQAWQLFKPTEYTEAGWRGNMKGRISLDFGVHVFDLIRFFFEENPLKIYAHMPYPYGDNSEVLNIISLEFSD